MIIANPLYDVVFKSLMEDVEIARGLVSMLTGLNVVELQARPRETAISIETGHNVTIYRLDYVATVKDENGAIRKVLIEVQKAKLGSEIRRFREYLGKQYAHPETVTDEDGAILKVDPHIIAIYILGFTLGDDVPAYAKVDRKYMDVLSGGHFEADCEFIEALSHDMYILQAPKIGHRAKNELERLVSIFSQTDFAEENEHTISYPDPLTKAKSKLLKRILRHLTKLSASAKVREQMEAEDQAYSEFEAAVQTQMLAYKKGIKEERRQKEEERRQKEEERRQKEEALKREEKALQQLRGACDALIKSGMTEKQAKKMLGL